jgi:2'-5' RNA ligase
MAKLAVDIVLLPSENMMDYAVEISSEQSEKYNEKILLNNENCLPHISLVMGVIDSDSIFEITKILKEVATQFSALKLNTDKYESKVISSGEVVSEFTIGKTKELQTLHELVMNKFDSFLSRDATIEMIYSPPVVDKLTLGWINGYLKNSSFEKFKPHITTGFGKVDLVATPISFSASKLALCHLGNFCTCRKILASVHLEK